jgi:transcription antitermination factor NusG
MATLETIHDRIAALPPQGQFATGNAKWFAIQTRPRHEKKVNVQLQAKGVEGFLPLVTEKRRWSDRFKVVQQPLFSCYMFVHIPQADPARTSVLTTEGVCWFVGNCGRGLPIPDKQIQDIQTVLNGVIPFAPYPYVRTGQRVRVRGGCLDGVEGVLVSKGDDPTVVVSVELLRRAVAVHISGYDLEGL